MVKGLPSCMATLWRDTIFRPPHHFLCVKGLLIAERWPKGLPKCTCEMLTTILIVPWLCELADGSVALVIYFTFYTTFCVKIHMPKIFVILKMANRR